MLSRRLDEKVGTMQIDCLRVLKSRKERFISGAVSGSMLYLTSLQAPILGAILCFDLTQHDKAPFVSTPPSPLPCLPCSFPGDIAMHIRPVLRSTGNPCLAKLNSEVMWRNMGRAACINQLDSMCAQWSILESLPAVERDVEHMIALEGSLYIYGGTRKTPGGDEEVLTDILVARAGNNGIVNQPWKRVLIREWGLLNECFVTPVFLDRVAILCQCSGRIIWHVLLQRWPA